MAFSIICQSSCFIRIKRTFYAFSINYPTVRSSSFLLPTRNSPKMPTFGCLLSNTNSNLAIHWTCRAMRKAFRHSCGFRRTVSVCCLRLGFFCNVMKKSMFKRYSDNLHISVNSENNCDTRRPFCLCGK